MSRSKTKKPIFNDYSRNKTKYYKRLANKKVRKYNKNITKGNNYKKIFCSYNIFDMQGYCNEPKYYRK